MRKGDVRVAVGPSIEWLLVHGFSVHLDFVIRLRAGCLSKVQYSYADPAKPNLHCDVDKY